jgi:hypothetical protein
MLGKQVDQEKAAWNNYFFLTARNSSMQDAIQGDTFLRFGAKSQYYSAYLLIFCRNAGGCERDSGDQSAFGLI